MLSLLETHSWDGAVRGMNEFPPADRPPMLIPFYGFRAMVAIGFIIGVIQDSMETAINSSSDVIFTATAEYRAMAKKGFSFKMGRDASGPEPQNAIGATNFDEPSQKAEQEALQDENQ